MSKLSQLDLPQSSGIIVHILSAIAQQEKKFKPQQLLMSRYFASNDLPRLKNTETTLAFQFELDGVSPVKGQFTTGIAIELDPKHLDQIGDVTASKVIRNILLTCSCTETTKPCVHQVHCLNYLRRQLTQRNSSDAIEWMLGCITDGRQAGRKLVESLGYLKPEIEEVLAEAEPDEDPDRRLQRIQWRLQYSNYGVNIHAYLQTSRKRGGWNKGRLLRDNFDTVPDIALSHPADKMLVLVLQSAEDSYRGQTPRVIRECLRLLIDHPNCTLDDPVQTPLRIREVPIEVRLEQEGEVFKPAVFQSNVRIDAIHEDPTVFLGTIHNTESLLLRIDRERHILWMSTIESRILRLINDLSAADRREAVMDRDTAEKFADLIIHVAKPKRLEVQLPEALAGPEQPLEPKIELHLSPRGKEGLQVALRVACDALVEPPVPGQEPERLRVATTAGRYQLLRALEEEASRADEYAHRSELQVLAYDGPYTWVAATPDEALDLLQRIQNLGDLAQEPAHAGHRRDHPAAAPSQTLQWP
jgi:hypothetical protein